nr:MAG TPA: hypothetical protein [Caudoviricetes sp.]
MRLHYYYIAFALFCQGFFLTNIAIVVFLCYDKIAS